MSTKRKTYSFRKGEVLEVEEFHDGNYGAPGQKREKRRKATPEAIIKMNHRNKVKRCRHKLLEYFDSTDLFVTLTYRENERPPDMAGAKKDFEKFIRRVRYRYKKENKEVRFIRNIEQGTRGGWHIHMVINAIKGSQEVLQDAWNGKGAIYLDRIKTSGKYDPDCDALARYLTKDETVVEKKKDGTDARPRIKSSSYSTSKNMPLKQPKEKILKRWAGEVKVRKNYYLKSIHEGINPLTGFKYRRYTMVRLI